MCSNLRMKSRGMDVAPTFHSALYPTSYPCPGWVAMDVCGTNVTGAGPLTAPIDLGGSSTRNRCASINARHGCNGISLECLLRTQTHCYTASWLQVLSTAGVLPAYGTTPARELLSNETHHDRTAARSSSPCRDLPPTARRAANPCCDGAAQCAPRMHGCLLMLQAQDKHNENFQAPGNCSTFKFFLHT